MFKNSAVYLLFCLAICWHTLSAQLPLKGTVHDKANKKPIAFAQVFLQSDHSHLVITNQIGQFNLNLPNDLATETLVVRQMGYRDQYIDLSKLQDNQTSFSIALSSNQTILEEPTDLPELSLKEIVYQAIERVPLNYPTSRHRLKAFFHEYMIIDSANTHLTACFATLEDQSYSKVKDRTVFLEELRRTRDLQEDTTSTQFVTTSRNELLMAFESGNIIRNRRVGHPSDIKRFFYKSDFWYLGQAVENADTLIRIGFTSKTIRLDPNNSKPYFPFVGELVINKTDYAIVRSRLDFEEFDFYWEVRYQKTGEKYYPQLILSFASGPLKDDTRKYSRSGLYHIYAIQTNKREFTKFKPAQQIIPEQSLQDLQNKYHPEFWNNNTFFLPLPAPAALKKDLTRKQALVDQFTDRAKQVYQARRK